MKASDLSRLLLNSDYSAAYLQQLWKKVRKQGGLCTGISQNVTDLLQNDAAATLISNSEFNVLMKQSNIDSVKLAETIGISDAQLRYVSNSSSGTGLIKCGSIVIPFDNTIPKDSALYKLYNTNLHEKIAEGLVSVDDDIIGVSDDNTGNIDYEYNNDDVGCMNNNDNSSSDCNDDDGYSNDNRNSNNWLIY